MKRAWIRSLVCGVATAMLAGCGEGPSSSQQTAGDGGEEAAVTSEAPSVQIDGTAASATGIENVQWELVSLGGQPIDVSAERRPNLTLSSSDQRVAGYAGCNRIIGSYSLSDDRLTFSQLAGTRMACAEGMETEQAFHDALGKVAGWRLQGEQLELLDSAGEVVALFERREG
jgi:heat shock protein HslJ